jgi:RimJ/RimL family protein N-acetyltransferase
MIETDRLILRPLQEEDQEDLLKIFGDPEVMKAFDEPPYTDEQMTWWLQKNIKHYRQDGYGAFAVIEKSSGELIGDCALEHMDVDGDQAVELGYDFRSDFWNQSFATEAAAAVRNFAFSELRLNRLISIIRVGNQASKRVSEKIGMSFEYEVEHRGIRYWKYSIQAEK